MMRTIRSRMIVSILGVILLCWAVLIPLTQSQTRAQISDLMYQRAESMAGILLAMLETEVEVGGSFSRSFDPNRSTAVLQYQSDTPFPFQLWVDGEMRAKSASAPNFKLPKNKSVGWRTLNIDGKDWRVLSLHKSIRPSETNREIDIWTLVALEQGELNKFTAVLVRRSSWPLIISLPILAIAILFSIGIVIKPLLRIAKQLEEQSPLQLTPLPSTDLPTEVQTLVDALNQLFESVQRALSNEKRFTADAAHELRTPLAALRAQAQIARSTVDETVRQKALGQIIDAVDRVTHLVSQLLTLARLDAKTEHSDAIETATVDLVVVTRDVMAEVASTAIEKNIDLSLSAKQPVFIEADIALLSVLLQNLLSNAIKYTPSGGLVDVSIERQTAHVVLSVRDSGPGIPEEFFDQVMQRFFRLNGVKGFGTGLGLSISQRVATLHKATIRLQNGNHDNDQEGLTVSLSFPID